MDQTDLTTARAEARVGSLLDGRWRLDRLIGVGGMAAVYAATHRNTKRVAVKILHAEFSVDDNARQRFLREGYAANQVGHPGAVTADDDGMTEDGVAFLVLELLEGETIEERSVRQGGTLKTREVLALMDQALATLEAAHEKGIVHRDLKPENLFLTRDGVVKVLDFGIARVSDRSGSPSQTQGIMGTPSFMAPEQARGRWQDVDARSDLWAIGATMFTLLSGRFVHTAETANEALVAAVTERAPSLATVAAHVPPVVVALVDKALAYEREGRFQTASELRDALKAADAALAGEEASPSLRVPELPALSVAQAAPISQTTAGVAASVRGAHSSETATSTRRAKAPFAIAGLAAIALVVLLGRGLFGAAGKLSTLASDAHASAALVAPEPAVTATPAVAPTGATATLGEASPAPPPSAAAKNELSPVQLAPNRAPKRSHSSATRAAVLASAPERPHVNKTEADLLKKRH